jgi:hypothetical protein
MYNRKWDASYVRLRGNRMKAERKIMKLVPTKEKVQIKLFVWAGDEMIPHTSKMAGKWGWDFECSCGFKSQSGGAIKACIRREIQEHKFYAHDYEYTIRESK